MVRSLLNHKRVGGVYFSLKFKQLVFVNFSPLVLNLVINVFATQSTFNTISNFGALPNMNKVKNGIRRVHLVSNV